MSLSKKHIILTSILIILLILTYVFYLRIKQHTYPPIKAIPENASFILKVNNANKLLSNLSGSNNMWKEISKIKSFKKLNKQIHFLDSITSKNNNISEIVKNHNIYISAHTTQDEKIVFLYLIQLPNLYQKLFIHKFIKNIFKNKCTINSLNYNNKTNINYVIIPEKDKIFSYSIYKGVFIGSYNANLVKKSIDQLNSKTSINNDIAFKKVYLTEGKKVKANIYINFKYFYKILSNYALKKHIKNIYLLSDFAQWSELDLNLKKDKLFLNGYTVASDTNKLFLNLFRNQPFHKNKLISIFPYNTCFFIDFDFEDFNNLYKNYKSFLTKNSRIKQYKQKIKSLNKKYDKNIEKTILPCIGNEIALIITKTNSLNIKDNTFAVFQTKNIKKTKNSLNKLSKKTKTIYYGYTIKHIDIPYLMPLFFGPLFNKLETNYYTNIDEYIIFANSVSSLKDFINNYKSGYILDKNKFYKNFSENTFDKSNIYLYYNFRNSFNMYKEFLNKDFAFQVDSNFEKIKKFDALSIQFSLSNKQFYTNLYLKYNPFYKDQSKSIWQTSLDANIYGKPYFVKNHRNKKLMIIVFDNKRNMYLINNLAKIKWKIPIKENVKSKIYQVDYYKNGKIQYLFNTENYLYLIDINGNNVANYPIKLKTKANNGISVFDYNKNKDYRILIAENDNKIYNYNIKGKLVKGWKIPKVKAKVTVTIQHLFANNKDYIIIPENNGNVIITDRRGRTKIKIIKSFTNSLNSNFYVNKTNSKGCLLTTDKNGKIIYISKKGKISSTIFNKFSENHYFIYADFDNNNSKDFIYLDKNKLYVYNKFKKLIYYYEFKTPIKSKPIFKHINSKEKIIGVVSKETKRIYLFNHNGLIRTSTNFVGETPFIIGRLNNKKQLNLITGSGETLYNYLIE